MKKQKRLITILVVVALIILMQAIGINFLSVFNEAEKINFELDEVEETDIQGGDSER